MQTDDVLTRYLPAQESPKSFQVSGLPGSFDSLSDRFDRIKIGLEVSRVDAFQAVFAAGLDVIEPAALAKLNAADSEAAG